jgi:hypothetical protein
LHFVKNGVIRELSQKRAGVTDVSFMQYWKSTTRIA